LSDAPHLLIHEDGPILIATLNRPEKLNALSSQVFVIFEEALHRFRDTPELKVMLIRATGRYFSAGADLFEGGHGVSDMSWSRSGSGIREHHRLAINGMHRIYDEMEHIEKPIVAAHHAPCVGGGLEMSLSCDFRLAAKSAHYSFPEAKQGVIPASNGVSRLTRICGPHWARYMIMANKIATAERALIMGLVHEVFPDETFEEDVMAFCRHLAEQNGEVMGTAKVAIEMAWDVSRDQARNVERLANSTLMLNPQWASNTARHLANIGRNRQPAKD
jgi:enoyl-CoA hydratase/carnithine racemase